MLNKEVCVQNLVCTLILSQGFKYEIYNVSSSTLIDYLSLVFLYADQIHVL